MTDEASAAPTDEPTSDDPYAGLLKQLRGPVSSIQSYVRTLIGRDEGLSTTARHTIHQVILQHSLRLDAFLDDVVLYVRLLSGAVPAKPEPILVAALAEEVRHRSGQPERVRIDVPDGVVAHADRNALTEAVRRLVRNGLVYGPRKGDVTISAQTAGAWVEILVSDEGVGIPAEQVDRALQPFVRAVGDSERRSDGAGLGLAVAGELAKLLGGEITLRQGDPGLVAVLRLPS